MTVATNNTIARLAAVPLFRSADRPTLARLAEAADVESVPAGETLLDHGQPITAIYVVVSGSVEVIRNGRAVERVGAGRTFGELSVFEAGPATATVVAGSETRLLILPSSALLTIMDEHEGLTRSIATELARRLAVISAQAVVGRA